MELRIRFALLSLILIIPQLLFAQFAPLQWDQEGLAIRQGDHIQWTRADTKDESGNVIYTWADARDGHVNIYAQKISPTGQKLWGEEGITVIDEPGLQLYPELVHAGSGEYIFAWIDYRDDEYHGDLYAQKIDANGNLLWDQDGVLLSTGDFYWPTEFEIVPDGAGGAMMLWIDSRNGNPDVYAIRITDDGTVPPSWPQNGLAVTIEPASQDQLVVDTDGAGGAIVAWVDNQNPATYKDIYAQRVTIAGELWNNGTPIPICTAENQQNHPRLCSDESGGAYIVWEDERDDYDGDLYFHHLRSDGSLVFHEPNGKVLINDPAYMKEQGQARIAADVSGNAIIIWLDARDSWPGEDIFDIYAQKVDSTGSLLWNPTGNPICTNPTNQDRARLNADGDSGAVVTWMDERDGNEIPFSNIFAQKINADGSVAWMVDGVPVCEADGYQENPIIKVSSGISTVAWGDRRTGSDAIWYQKINQSGIPILSQDGEALIDGIDDSAREINLVKNELGNIFIFYEDFREGWSGCSIFTQIIDTLGNTQLPQDGIPVCPDPEYLSEKDQYGPSACSDGENGAIIVWEDHRDTNPFHQIYAQRIGMDGALHWGEAGLHIEPSQFGQFDPQIIEDGEGGGIVAWDEVTPTWDRRVMAARIDHLGGWIWTTEVADNYGLDDILEALAPDGNGGAYICYYNLVFPPIPDYNLYAQHLDAVGQLLWGDSSVVICDDTLYQLDCRIASLESDGAVFVWEDKRNASDYDIYAQRVNYEGDLLWAENGIPVIDLPEDQLDADMSLNEEGNVFIVWEDWRNQVDMDVYMQKLLPTGQKLYPDSGLAVCLAEYDQRHPRIQPDENGGNYIVWYDLRSGVSSDIYGTHLDANGQLSTETVPGWSGSWVQNGNIICNAAHWQFDHEITGDCANGLVVVWEDKRASIGNNEFINIYTQRLNGYVVGVADNPDKGEIPSAFELHQSYPNPFNQTATIRFSIPNRCRIKLYVLDIAGRLVAEITEGWREAGVHNVFLDAAGFSSGIYIIRLSADKFTAAKKMVLMK